MYSEYLLGLSGLSGLNLEGVNINFLGSVPASSLSVALDTPDGLSYEDNLREHQFPLFNTMPVSSESVVSYGPSDIAGIVDNTRESLNSFSVNEKEDCEVEDSVESRLLDRNFSVFDSAEKMESFEVSGGMENEFDVSTMMSADYETANAVSVNGLSAEDIKLASAINNFGEKLLGSPKKVKSIFKAMTSDAGADAEE